MAFDGRAASELHVAPCQELAVNCAEELGLWKADVDAAYRRVPLNQCDHWAAHVAFVVDGETYVAGHLALPFGATGSVHGWDRPGAMVAAVARRILHIAAARYVDDYFGPEPAATMHHCMTCFERLAACMLGKGSMSAHKLQCGKRLTILGLEIQLASEAFHCKPAGAKAVQWLERIDAALAQQKMCAGEASKLSGALSWTASNLNGRTGRGMLRPLFGQSRSRSSALSSELNVCLRWWLRVLRLDLYTVCRADLLLFLRVPRALW